MDVNTYYTRMRTLWNELNDFQPIPTCNCGTKREWAAYQNQECGMQFLMGLNDSYTHIRTQILMMDPMPVISKILSLMMQEERQRSIHNDVSILSNSTTHQISHAAVVKGPTNGKGAKSDKLIDHIVII